MYRQKGLGLPELMISLLLASFLSIALVQHYQTIKRQYRYIQTAFSENIDLQLVTDLIRNSARNAGFTPCVSIDHLVATDHRYGQKKIAAIDVSTSLQINRMSPYFNTVTKILGEDQLTASTDALFQNHQAIVISDCYHAEVQNIRQIRHHSFEQTIILEHPLLYSYYFPVYIGAWVEDVYTIRQIKDHPSALYFGGLHPEELSPHVHALSAHIETYCGRRMLQVSLGLEHGHQIPIDTMIRL